MTDYVNSGRAVAQYFVDELEKIATTPALNALRAASREASDVASTAGWRKELGALGIGGRDYQMVRAAKKRVGKARASVEAERSQAYRAATHGETAEEREAARKILGGSRSPSAPSAPPASSSSRGSLAALGLGATSGLGAGVYGMHMWNNRNNNQGY